LDRNRVYNIFPTAGAAVPIRDARNQSRYGAGTNQLFSSDPGLFPTPARGLQQQGASGS
jgi:hypothetical protein